MSLLVPDSSLILKWVVPPDNEPHVKQALALREAFLNSEVTLRVPSLWYFEIGNTLARKFREESANQLRNLRRLGMTEVAVTDQWQKENSPAGPRIRRHFL